MKVVGEVDARCSLQEELAAIADGLYVGCKRKRRRRVEDAAKGVVLSP